MKTLCGIILATSVSTSTVGTAMSAIDISTGRQLMVDDYLSDFVTPCPPSPGPEAWPFRAELARPVLRKAPEKFALDDGYGLTGCLETVADDLRDFLGGTRKLCLRRGKVEGAESYRVEVTPEAVTLTAEDDDGMRRAVYWFEDRVLAGDLHAAVRRPWLRNRISRCFFGPIKRPPFNRDELMDDIDYYPDAYLNRLAHEGVNGLWLTVERHRLLSRRLSEPTGARRRQRAVADRRVPRFGGNEFHARPRRS